nr:non-homologous end-joining DNA ligase [Myxococcota bacterium]
QLHWDLRLEWDGVLLSWAVPRGPSRDPAEKRLAVQVEDHPLDYADFEGVIPEGNYGAGNVIVWDLGRWTPVEDPAAGLESGKLLFDLDGYKLRGRYTLVRTRSRQRGSSREWLLIKKPDAWASAEDELPDESVLSGRTLDELGARTARRPRAVSRAVARLDPPRRRVDASALRPMLAEARERPFSRAGWVFEPKYDGYRVLAAHRGDEAQLFYRSGRSATQAFPEIARAVGALPGPDAILDGEVVVLDASGRPSFQLLQKRAQLSRGREIERAAVELPVHYYAFDLLAWGDRDLRGLPLVERKRLLEKLLPAYGPLRYAPHFAERGDAVYAESVKLGFEGVVAKRADAPYRSGRSSHWQKVRARPTDDFVVVGWSAPRGGRTGFGALHLARYDEPAARVLRYAGRVGSGFREDDLRSLRTRLEPLRRPDPPCEGPLPTARGHHWVEPSLVAEVQYAETTSDGLLRQPVFLRLRADKRPEECVAPPTDPDRPSPDSNSARSSPASAEGARSEPKASEVHKDAPAPATTPYAGSPASAEGARSEAKPSEVHQAASAQQPDPLGHPASAEGARSEAKPSEVHQDRSVPFTNLDKVFWPADGTTKGDLIEYHRRIAPWLLPYLRDRPLVLTRYPDGIDGKSFFQKDAPSWVPAWLRTETLWSQQSAREIHYFVCDDVESLLYLVNLGTIPLHVWSSRVTSLPRPDWCILDLDPKGAPFAHVAEVARAVRGVCDEIELPSFVKTSGSTGLHVLLPLARQLTYEQSRTLAELIARTVVRERPEIATVTRAVRKRGGRVYVDFLQNGHGQLLVAPFSARPLPGAPVSMPLRWREVRPGLDIHRFTIRNAAARMRRLREDPLLGVLDAEPDLLGALERLGERLGTAT